MTQAEKPRNASKWTLFAVIAVCAAPMLLSYFTYYVIKPEKRTNYGDLIDPRAHPIPALSTATLDGKPLTLDAYRGKWMLLQVDEGACAEPCKQKLWAMRQLRLAQGKQMERVERVWLVTDRAPLDTALMKEYDGTRVLRADAAKVSKWLPTDTGTRASEHLYLIDPLGNLMMRFPKEADPNRIKRDLSKVLRASAIG